MKINHLKNLLFCLVELLFLFSCKEQNNIANNQKKQSIGIIEYDIQNYEKLIPNSIYNSNHVVIWRVGSIYYSDYGSCLIIDKKQLNDKQLLCYYMKFEVDKPSNYRDWKLTTIYELRLENKPFKFRLRDKTIFTEIDSLCFECQCEGIKANVYFMKEFNSDEVYPIHRKHNKYLMTNIEYLFKQISKKEHVQSLSLKSDSINLSIVKKIIKSDSLTYCINDEGESSRLQRMWGDK